MQAIYKDITKLPRVESATMDTGMGNKPFIVLTNLSARFVVPLADIGYGLCLGGTQHHPPANPQP